MKTDAEFIAQKDYENHCNTWANKSTPIAIWDALVMAVSWLRWYMSVRKNFRSRYRTKIFVFSPKWKGLRCIVSFSYEENYPQLILSPGWGALYITLPIKGYPDDYGIEGPQYGFYYHEASLWFFWGIKPFVLHLPYEYDWVRTSLLLKDQNSWDHETKTHRDRRFWDESTWQGIRFEQTFPYTYTLESGEQQQTTATVTVKEWEWRMRWLRWTRWGAKVRRSIDVRFADELGERSGSYKGGVTGCSYDIQPGETPEQTLRRMETERKFT